jgi:hypothetical protein
VLLVRPLSHGALATTSLCLGLGTMALRTGGEDQERG